MAAKDNQGLQAIIIVLTILVILLGAGLIFVNNSKKTAQARATEAENQAQSLRTSENQVQVEANQYKQWMGFPEGDAFASIQETVQQDLTEYGANFQEEDRSYRELLARNEAERRNSANNEAAAKRQLQEQAERIKALQEESEARIGAAQDELKKAKADMAAELNKFNQQREEFKKQLDAIQQQLAEVRQQGEASLAELNTQTKSLQTRVDDLSRSNTLLQENQVEPDPFAQPADGKVTWVNQRYGKAWVNIGSADGLRPQVTFSVYAPNELDATNAVKKASVEVVRVLEPHLAEVRITDDDPKNPVVPGDKIYSQVWDQGRKLGFAIAGKIDIDNDDEDDLELLKRIIQTSGGEVHAAPGEENQMTVQTRYLILGDYPSGSAPGTDRLQQHWSETSDKADDLNVETISVDEFVKLMGWKSENKAVALGSAARPDDFPATTRGTDLPAKPSRERGTFLKRLPPTPY